MVLIMAWKSLSIFAVSFLLAFHLNFTYIFVDFDFDFLSFFRGSEGETSEDYLCRFVSGDLFHSSSVWLINTADN